MGVTIHYQLRVASVEGIPPLLDEARQFAAARGWRVHEIDRRPVNQYRFGRPIEDGYIGPASGVVIEPDEHCEPVWLEFGSDLIACAWTKTAFAGSEVHQQVVALLDALVPHVEDLIVEDETDFWETRDPSVLSKHLQTRAELEEDRIEWARAERGLAGGQPDPN